MLFHIQPDADVPIYEQIVNQATYAIAAGAWLAGETIPSIRELAPQLMVHPNTVARAYQELERRGLLETRRGKGMEVTSAGMGLAQTKRQEIVRDRIRQTLREAASALPEEELRQIIAEELAHINGTPKSRGKH